MASVSLVNTTSPLSPDSSFERIAAVLRSSSPQQLDMPSVHAKARAYLDSIFAKNEPSDIDPKQLHEALSIAKTFRLLSVSHSMIFFFENRSVKYVRSSKSYYTKRWFHQISIFMTTPLHPQTLNRWTHRHKHPLNHRLIQIHVSRYLSRLSSNSASSLSGYPCKRGAINGS